MGQGWRQFTDEFSRGGRPAGEQWSAAAADRQRAGHLTLDAAQLAQSERRAECGAGAGDLVEIAGRKLLYLLGFALFGALSLWCGFASDLPQLVALRTLLGFAGAMLSANAIVILVQAAGPDRQERAIGIIAAAQAVGVSIGPMVGGVLLTLLDWRWCGSAPSRSRLAYSAGSSFRKPASAAQPAVGSGAAPCCCCPPWLSAAAVTEKRPLWPDVAGDPRQPVIICRLAGDVHPAGASGTGPADRFDPVSSISFATGIVGVVLSACDALSDVVRLRPRLSRHPPRGRPAARDRAAGARHRSPVHRLAAGLAGGAHVLVCGMAVCIAGLLLFSDALTGTADNLTGAMVALGVYGAGLGLFIAPNNSATMSAAPRERSGQAGGLLKLLRMFGTSLWVAGAAALLSSGLGRKPEAVPKPWACRIRFCSTALTRCCCC